MSPSVRTFGKYLLDEEIARGGMSRVFLARLRGLGGFEKRLIVKQVLPELASDPRFVEMFVTEAKTLVQMSHPHIAPVYELGVVDGVYFLAMEYVEGATLAQILGEGRLAPGLAAHFGAEICDALHYAHSRFEIIHRDVTPRNVIVDSAGHSRLLDFGIAAPAKAEDGEAEKGAELFGTPGYLSPEQLRGEPLGPPSDVFSLGAVLFEALTGRRAFPGNTVDATKEELAAEGPSFEEGEAPPELAEIVERTMRRDPEARFATARELGRALRGWLASHAPEGVGPELGVRAEHAEPTREERQAARLSKPNAEAGGADAEVKTLATSRLLDDMMEGRPARVRSPARSSLDSGAVDLDDADAPGTVPIDGRRSTPEPEPRDEDAPRTAAIAGRRSAQETEHEVDTEDDRDEEEDDEAAPDLTRHVAVPRAPAPQFNDAWWLAAAIVGVLGALAWALWPSGPPRGTDPSTRLDRPPLDAFAFTTDAAPFELDAGAASAMADAGPPRSAVGTPGTATLTVTSTPGGAVTLDDQPLGDTPVRAVAVRAGPHLLVVQNERLGREARATFEASAEQTIVFVADLAADPPTLRANGGSTGAHPDRADSGPPPARTATLTVNASPWGTVILDGHELGNTPVRGASVRAGRHTLVVRNEPLASEARATFDAEGGQTITYIADLNHDPPTIDRRGDREPR